MKREKWTMVILLLALAALGGMAVVCYRLSVRNDDLTAQISELQQEVRRGTVLRSVSGQMEEIAYEQKAISDEQREEALRQSRLANEMRERSEVERQNAIIAQKSALASERKALDAYDQAEQQRLAAEHQRIQAELSKRVTDTLSYVALGRSLGSMASAQWEAGNRELASLLCYAAYDYTNTYHGNIYYPSVYKALSLCSQSVHNWPEHEGAVMGIDFSEVNPRQIVSVSNYGEVIVHEKQGDRLTSRSLLKDSRYDFREDYVHPVTGDIYAVDRNGSIFLHTAAGNRTIPIEGVTHPFDIEPLDGDHSLLIVGEDGMAELNMTGNTVTATKKTDFRPVCVSRIGDTPVIFDNKGKMHIVRSMDRIEMRKVPVPGQVTAFASSSDLNYEVYGMDNGIVFLKNGNDNIQRLVGHRSRISKVMTHGARLYTASYDGLVNLWMTNDEKIEPMTLLSVNSWIMTFTFDNSKNYLWVCDQRGALSESLISVSMMADKVRKNISREFTDEEWNYYFGKNIPRQRMMK